MGQPLPNRVIDLLRDDPSVEFFQTPDRRSHVTFQQGGRRETCELTDHAFELYIAATLIHLEKAPSATVIKSVLTGCEVLASTGPSQQVYTRVADLGDQVVIDLADETGSVVVCTSAGWMVLDASPVAFRRPPGMLALPTPRPMAGALPEFRDLVGEITGADFGVIIAWLVVALRGREPYPLLLLWGGTRSGKTTLAEMLRGLVDPNTVLLRPLPDSQRDLAIMADRSAVLMFDNVSEITREMSDCLCRFTSGGGYSTRRLYRNREEELFEISRPALITSIHQVIHAEDLYDRTWPVHLEPLAQRKLEADLDARYDQLRPAVLAELLDGVCASLAPTAPPSGMDGLPRLLDAALTADAALARLGFGEQALTRALQREQHLQGPRR